MAPNNRSRGRTESRPSPTGRTDGVRVGLLGDLSERAAHRPEPANRGVRAQPDLGRGRAILSQTCSSTMTPRGVPHAAGEDRRAGHRSLHQASGRHRRGGRPARAIREAIQLMNRPTGGERTSPSMASWSASTRGISISPRRAASPSVVAARATRAGGGGELADGVVIGSFASDRGMLADWATSAGGPPGRPVASLTSGSSPGCTRPSGDNREEVRAGVRKGSQSPCGEVARSCPSCLPEDITRLMTDHAYGAADEVISGGARAYRIGCWTSVR